MSLQNQFFNSHAICKFNRDHISESNRYVLYLINYQLISIPETVTGESAAATSAHYVNEDDCVECLRRSVSFAAVCASAC